MGQQHTPSSAKTLRIGGDVEVVLVLVYLMWELLFLLWPKSNILYMSYYNFQIVNFCIKWAGPMAFAEKMVLAVFSVSF